MTLYCRRLTLAAIAYRFHSYLSKLIDDSPSVQLSTRSMVSHLSQSTDVPLSESLDRMIEEVEEEEQMRVEGPKAYIERMKGRSSVQELRALKHELSKSQTHSEGSLFIQEFIDLGGLQTLCDLLPFAQVRAQGSSREEIALEALECLDICLCDSVTIILLLT